MSNFVFNELLQTTVTEKHACLCMQRSMSPHVDVLMLTVTRMMTAVSSVSTDAADAAAVAMAHMLLMVGQCT